MFGVGRKPEVTGAQTNWCDWPNRDIGPDHVWCLRRSKLITLLDRWPGLLSARELGL